ncbi:TNF receptor-associated factor 2, partial [Geodia barretti]
MLLWGHCKCSARGCPRDSPPKGGQTRGISLGLPTPIYRATTITSLQVKRKNWEAHFREDGALFKHMSSLQHLLRSLHSSHRQLYSKLDEKQKLMEVETTATGELSRVETELKAFQSQYENRLTILQKKLGALDTVRGDIDSVRRDCSKLTDTSKTMGGRLEAQEDKLKQVQGQVVTSKGRPSSGASRYGDSFSDSRMAVVERKIEELERQNTMLKVHVSELELQLQASLASTHNGSFLWRIPDVARRRRDAIEERITSIYSPPFYTGRNGYKMCIRAYLNGDGIGFKTHLSLFFVLMRGEYDPLLKWPFEHKVSLILVDQDHRKHIVQTFKPTPESSSFKRPTSDMNVASGCP